MSPWILVYIFGGLVQRWPHLRGFRHITLPEQVQNHEQPSNGAGAGSSPVSRNLVQYDVFLNHRGCDVKKTFLSYLYDALRRTGYYPFLDEESLVKGYRAPNSIDDALKGALVHVAVFSPNYADSPYCLNELCDMLASGKPLIPVFYNVDPEDVQCPEEGRYAEAFMMWRGMKGRDQDVERWKGALMEAGVQIGIISAKYTKETEVVNDIVEAVKEHLPPAPLIPLAPHPVGLKEKSLNVINMLQNMGENVGVMGIYGMGGIGKTALATEVYNQEQSRFKNSCFLKKAKGIAIIELQKKLVVNLLGRDGEKMVEDYARCLQMIYKKRVLIVVDDVSGCEQFEELIPDLNQLAPGSCIIITSRESDISELVSKGCPNVKHALYPVCKLNPSDSLELFMWHTFGKRSLDEVEKHFHDKVGKIVEACDGLPLALMLIGRSLGTNIDLHCWDEAVRGIGKVGDIFTTLKISYDGLNNNDEKKMFEDIACVMLGHPKDIAMEAGKSTTRFGSRSATSFHGLINKCLIEVDADGIITMHDLLRDMGRRIVEDRANGKLEMQTHIWEPSVAAKVLQRARGSSEIVALSLLDIESSPMENKASSSIVNKAEAYAKMTELRYLFLDKCLVNGDFSGWSHELKWLQWRSFPHQELPTSFNTENLAILDLANSHSLTHVRARNSEIELPVADLRVLILNNCPNLKELPHDINRFKKLKVLNLSGCFSLTLLPEFLGDLTELEELDLSECLLEELPSSMCKLGKLRTLTAGWTALKELPEDFGQLTSLEKADFEYCSSLVRLPDSIGKLSNLEELRIGGCKVLEELPSSMCKMGKLRTLSAGQTALKELPEDFGQLTSLEMADFEWCESLVRLPDSIGKLSNLEELHLGGCYVLEELPSSMCKMGKLRTLTARRTSLKELPEDFGQLTSLEMADFEWCESLVRLPDSFGNLSNLEELHLGGCKVLEELPSSMCKLGKLRNLSAHLTALKELPEDFGQLTSLEKAHFYRCKSLVRMPDSFGNLSNLEELHLGGCKVLEELPSSMCKMGKLRTLTAGQTALKELPEDFGQLTSLESADFEGCERLVGLPDSFGNLSNLEELPIGGCKVLEELPSSMCKMGKLRTLTARWTSLKELPEDFGQLTSLEMADFEWCESLVRLPDSFGNLSNLEELQIRYCYVLEELPSSMCKMGKLRTLTAGQTALKELPEDFGQLTSLEKADFEGCISLVRLPDSIGKLSNLEELRIGGCYVLEELPSSMCKLGKLRTLIARGTALKELPEDFGQLTSLEKADFEGCKSLVRLPDSIGNLSNLEELNIGGCVKLKELPISSCKLGKLRIRIWYFSTWIELPKVSGEFTSWDKSIFARLEKLILKDLIGCSFLEITLPDDLNKYVRTCARINRL